MLVLILHFSTCVCCSFSSFTAVKRAGESVPCDLWPPCPHVADNVSHPSAVKKEGCKFQKKVRVYMKDSPLLCIYVSRPVVWQVKTILPKCVYVYTWHTFFSLFETEPCHTPCSFSLSLLCARTWKFTVVVTCLLERVLCFMGQVSWPDHPDAFS